MMVLAVMYICPMITEANPANRRLDRQKKTVVLDPGHGGHDKGAQGPYGTFEKTVTLNLARMIATELGNSYRVILTRTDDYWLDIPARTATANHVAADLFISIHTGGSYLHKASAMTLYYFKAISGTTLSFETDPSKPLKSVNTQIPWSNIQNRYQTTSQVVADLMLNRIKEQKIFIKNEIQGAPLMVLEGADMPAILIEIGYITNPAEEKSLINISVLSNIAKGIRKGIDDFFEKVK